MRTTTMIPAGLALLLPFAVGPLASCKGCTLVECDDGLAVRFSSAIPVGSTVTAASVAYGTRTVTCPPSGPCSSVFFDDFTPGEVSVTVDLASGPRTLTFFPDYRTFRPNGEGCDPACTFAEVDMPL